MAAAQRLLRAQGWDGPLTASSAGNTDTDGNISSSCPTKARSLAICAAIPTCATLRPELLRILPLLPVARWATRQGQPHPGEPLRITRMKKAPL